MKLYYNNSTAPYTLDFTIDDANKLSVTLYDNGASVGSCEQLIGSYNSYALLYAPHRTFLSVDRSNTLSRSAVKLIPTNRATHGARIRCDEIPDWQGGGMNIFQLDTKIVNENLHEMELILLRVKKDNVTFSLPDSIAIESSLPFDAETIKVNGMLRRSFWDTYALEIDDNVYHFSEFGVNQGDSASAVSMDGREYVDCTIRKYSNGFARQLTRDDDNETVVVEALSGMPNTTRVKLENGVGTFRWYNFGYTGDVRIKLGWRWYSGINDITFAVTE